MKRRLTLLVFALLAPAALAQTGRPASALTETLKKVATRYAHTEERIEDLVGRRQHPQPLPAELPNPFYHGVELSELAEPEPLVDLIPEGPDVSDADTLAKIAPTLRITGLVILGGQPHLTINSITCKTGDVIPIPGRAVPTFVQVRNITTREVTLGLNDAELTIPLRL